MKRSRSNSGMGTGPVCVSQQGRKVCLSLGLVLSLGLKVTSAWAQPSQTFGSQAEWHEAEVVLMHQPGDEIFLGVLHPAAALFERTFSLDGARTEHRRFSDWLRSQGVKVHLVTDLLLMGTQKPDGTPLEGSPLQSLRALAARALSYDLEALPAGKLRDSQAKVLETSLGTLHPTELLKVVLQRPKIRLSSTGVHNTGLSARYEVDPLMNLYFMRDSMITTARGVVLANLNSVQRKFEVEVSKFVLGKLGVPILAEIQGDGRLEGGDFLPAGEVAFIGQGMRTNAQAIKQLMDQKAFGVPTVAVVKDPWKNQDQMHLDTYFNILGPKLAVLEKMRWEDKARKPEVDVYELKDGAYRKVRAGVDFRTYLEKTLGYRLLAVSPEDQAKYGVNFLALRGNRIVGVDGVSEGYKKQLKDLGVDAKWLDFSNLTGGYGAAHCMTQVLRRKPVP